MILMKLFYFYSDEGDTSSSSSEAGAPKEPVDVAQPAPPPSPLFPEINRNIPGVSILSDLNIYLYYFIIYIAYT